MREKAKAQDRSRQMTAEEQAMFDQHTILGPRGQPRLVIDQQSFDIDNDGHAWKRERAEWYRRQIAIALARMVAAETAALRAERDALRAAGNDLAGMLRNAIEAIDAAYDGPDDNGRYSTKERAALAEWEAAQK